MEHNLRDVMLPTILMKINVFFVSLDIIYNASGVCLVIVTFTRTLHCACVNVPSLSSSLFVFMSLTITPCIINSIKCLQTHVLSAARGEKFSTNGQ